MLCWWGRGWIIGGLGIVGGRGGGSMAMLGSSWAILVGFVAKPTISKSRNERICMFVFKNMYK